MRRRRRREDGVAKDDFEDVCRAIREDWEAGFGSRHTDADAIRWCLDFLEGGSGYEEWEYRTSRSGSADASFIPRPRRGATKVFGECARRGIGGVGGLAAPGL